MAKKYVYLFTDIESDGPVPGLYSMISFASVACSEEGKELGVFEANLKPLPDASQHPDTMAWWKTQKEAWDYSTQNPQDPESVIKDYVAWIDSYDLVPILAAHPICFDFMWIEWYIYKFVNRRVFQGPGLDIVSYASATFGCRLCDAHRKNWPKEWLNGYEHSHRAIDDAKGYANAFFQIRSINQKLNHDKNFISI